MEDEPKLCVEMHDVHGVALPVPGGVPSKSVQTIGGRAEPMLVGMCQEPPSGYVKAESKLREDRAVCCVPGAVCPVSVCPVSVQVCMTGCKWKRIVTEDLAWVVGQKRRVLRSGWGCDNCLAASSSQNLSRKSSNTQLRKGATKRDLFGLCKTG